MKKKCIKISENKYIRLLENKSRMEILKKALRPLNQDRYIKVEEIARIVGVELPEGDEN